MNGHENGDVIDALPTTRHCRRRLSGNPRGATAMDPEE
jgi:hypothetical protein